METIEALKQQRIDEARLRKEWNTRARSRPFYFYPHICDDGLLLGAATRIAKMVCERRERPFLQIEGEEERVLAMLSLAYKKAVSPGVLKFIKRASLQWSKGEKAIAHFELAFASLPRFSAREDAFRLFCADGLFKRGVSLHWLMRYQGLDTAHIDLLKYSLDQRRVPAGSGRESGQWTSDDNRGGAQAPSVASTHSSNEVMSDVSPDPVRPGEQYAQLDRPKWWMPYRVPIDGAGGGGSGLRTPNWGTSEAGEANGVARTIEISPDRFGQAAEHMRDAIKAGQPDVLTIDRAGTNANRAAATGGFEKVPGRQLDEYPPAMFKEGGVGASVRAISPHDNMSLGAYIGFCCRRLPNGARIKIRVGE